jgi:hypothetical protein
MWIGYTYIDRDLRYIFKGFQGGIMRQVHDRDFKLKDAKDIKSGSRIVAEIAGDFGISRPIVSWWLTLSGLVAQCRLDGWLHKTEISTREQVTGPG